tara:strand:+ start:2198 stop:2599 length:402 start_codon:yes stop_codon:yes gene_type:complete
MPLYGPSWPLKSGERDTYELYDDIKQQISFYLRNLLLTSPGENISDPSYGVGLRRFLFENNLESTRSLISSRITSQISRYLPYVDVEEVIVDATPEEIDSNTLNIKVVYRLQNDATTSVFELSENQTQNIGFY